MNKISSSAVVFVCIFALTHHSAITASASDLSPLSEMAVQEAANSAATTTTSASAVGATDLFAIGNEAGSRGGDDTTGVVEPAEGNRRQARSPFFFFGLDASVYGNLAGYYNPYYSYYPSFYNIYGVYNPYYGGYPPRVILG